ncbi:hypothetical protein B0H17DRAFT_1127251 [Mycena rosella]|uniref:Uncharacterized protein n=1 Tax=Mycena rosella TaxID=1033263 RepID=A0AAD7GR90_MYCRO|nr:hypothetical protein B0H17DRAFT_1127251 [Mycena rosella]
MTQRIHDAQSLLSCDTVTDLFNYSTSMWRSDNLPAKFAAVAELNNNLKHFQPNKTQSAFVAASISRKPTLSSPPPLASSDSGTSDNSNTDTERLHIDFAMEASGYFGAGPRENGREWFGTGQGVVDQRVCPGWSDKLLTAGGGLCIAESVFVDALRLVAAFLGATVTVPGKGTKTPTTPHFRQP